MASDKIVSGVFAINKPSGPTSADVIREAQARFRPSKLFAPWLAREQAQRDSQARNGRKRWRKWHDRQALQVKMGHGGTLDPEAKGVLVLGVGDGTKALSGFTSCSKSYECVVLFGASTDTYDGVGKVVSREPYEHITRESVVEALERFRGTVMQRPPIYSALRIQGKRLYEYAREGKELPREIQKREMHVSELEMTEWYEPGGHEYHWPTAEVAKDEKQAIEQLVKQVEQDHGDPDGESKDSDVYASVGAKRKRENDEAQASATPSNAKRARPVSPESEAKTPVEKPIVEETTSDELTTGSSATTAAACAAPACRIRMTVTSGFYVRSFCHDLGTAVGSAAFMAVLTRTRQGDFELGKNVLDYEDLEQDESVWGPKVDKMLEDWNTHGKESMESLQSHSKPRDERESSRQVRQAESTRRRNTSSPES